MSESRAINKNEIFLSLPPRTNVTFGVNGEILQWPNSELLGVTVGETEKDTCELLPLLLLLLLLLRGRIQWLQGACTIAECALTRLYVQCVEEVGVEVKNTTQFRSILNTMQRITF